MNLDFLLQNEPLQRLVSSYIELASSPTQPHSNTVNRQNHLLSSILVAVSALPQGLQALFNETTYNIEANESDRQCLQRAATLLTEVIKRSPHLLTKAPSSLHLQIAELSVKNAFSALSGNAFIALLQQLSSRADEATSLVLRGIFLDFLLSPKLLASTYRQDTRLCIYKMFLKELGQPQGLEKLSGQRGRQVVGKWIEKCVDCGSGEKDPRNIGCVFEIYLRLMDSVCEQELGPFRAKMFQILQAYYPIEFVGDQDNKEHQKINLREISGLLDQCLTHSFFKEVTWELFSAKMAAPPIAPFASSFLLYLAQRKQDTPPHQMAARLKNLLLRFCEDDFIGEHYDTSEYDLGDIFAGMLDCLFCSQDGSFSSAGYQAALSWVNTIVGKATNGECTHNGSLMNLLRNFMERARLPRFAKLLELFRHCVLKRVLSVLKNEDHIVPKLGITIVALHGIGRDSQCLREMIALLVLRVGQLYAEVPDEIKMLLLKILLEVFKGGSSAEKAMVRSTNSSLVLKDCLARAQWAFSQSLQGPQIFIAKAFIEFIAAAYAPQTPQLLAPIQGQSLQLESYLVSRLLQTVLNDEDSPPSRRLLILDKFSHLLKKVDCQAHVHALLGGLKGLDPRTCFYLLAAVQWPVQGSTAKWLVSFVIQLYQTLSSLIDEHQLELFQQKYRSELHNSFIKEIFGLVDAQKDISRAQRLYSILSGQEKLLFPTLHQLNSGCSFEAFAFDASLLHTYQPTLVHWAWQHRQQLGSAQQRRQLTQKLAEHLPEVLLLRDSRQVLTILVEGQQRGASLLRIVKHLEFETLRQTGIVDYCLREVAGMCENPDSPDRCTDRWACLLAVVIALVEKDSSGSMEKGLRGMGKGLNRLLLSRKRPIRQAVRRLLLLIAE